MNSFNARQTMQVGDKQYTYYSLKQASSTLGDISRLPFTLKVLLENLLRHEDGRSVTKDDVQAIVDWQKDKRSDHEIAYRPVRVLMQDFTGVPAVVDLAAMREAIVSLGGNAEQINPLSAVDLVIDHSVMVDEFGTADAFKKNVELEFRRNAERYEFLRWGQNAFDNFRVVPPGTGICHQVNLEYLAKTVWTMKGSEGDTIACPDTLVGTDSHTTMVNGMAVLGWGVGGIEAEAAMLGQPVSMVIPEVIGFKLSGKMPEGATATDLVLVVVEMLRKRGVVGKFVEFFGPGLPDLPLADRATIANMAPEYGATCGFFPIDGETLRYLEFTGRDQDTIDLVEAYAKEQGMWFDAAAEECHYTDVLELDMGSVVPSLAGPKRPQDRVRLDEAATAFDHMLSTVFEVADKDVEAPVAGHDYTMSHGDIVIAAITSCTNTSNPSVLVAAGLVAKKAHELGMKVKPWVKTSLAPGSQVVTDYLSRADLQKHLDAMGFDLVGYGCTTCIGNSGPLPGHIADAIEGNDLVACSVLSGNRNFEGRISQQVKANFLASPPLVVAYALAGSMKVDVYKDALGKDRDGNDVFLKDIWPSNAEVAATIEQCLTPQMFIERYSNVFKGTEEWQQVKAGDDQTYSWNDGSTYVKNPPFFSDMTAEPGEVTDIVGARMLAKLGDSITTDHISPAGAIKKTAPAGEYLLDHQVRPIDFNSYGSRRGNHEVMMRGTFANIRIKNELLDDVEGGYTRYIPTGEQMSIYDASMRYQDEGVPLIVVAGKEYGTGSSRDWAAKGTRLLGIKAVIAESFERIHRSNLVGMGVLPLVFHEGFDRNTLNLDGSETFSITGIEGGITPGMDLCLTITREDGSQQEVQVKCRIDTLDEVEYYRNGGILHYVLRNMMKAAA